jgi:hypothetical protein
MNEDIRDAIAIAEGLWITVRSNRYLVAFEGGAIASAGKFIVDAIDNGGRLDFSTAELHKLAGAAIAGGIIAVRLLNRPTPGSNPTSNQ